MTSPSPAPADPRDPRDRLYYSPITSRPRIDWPGGARVAFWISPNVEHYEYLPIPERNFALFPRVPMPDVQQYGLRDYGNRVGFWRFAEALDAYGIRSTVSLNAAVLEHFPEIARAMVERKWELMGHGLYNTRTNYGLSPDEERAELSQMCEIIERIGDVPVKGMLGPALSATLDTPDIMAELGMIYYADWTHDDQPTPVMVSGGRRMVSLPYTYELNDASPLNFNLEVVAANWKAQFDQLWKEGAKSGRVMHLALHPYIIAQPHAIDYLTDFFEYMTGHQGVWLATGAEIAQHYLDHHYDAHVAHALSLAGGDR